MRRRRFIQGIVAAPAVPALIAQQTTAPPAASAPAAPVGRGGRGAGRGGQGLQEIAKFQTTATDAVSEPVAHYFNPQQFSALRRLSAILAPPMRGAPGALECGAPEFLDFLISVSPADRQRLYKTGLDYLNAQAKKRYSKAFSEVDAMQADAIIKPLIVPVPWQWDSPKDLLQSFMYAARRDVTTATRNSREASATASAAGRRGGGGGGLFWNPIDPVVKG